MQSELLEKQLQTQTAIASSAQKQLRDLQAGNREEAYISEKEVQQVRLAARTIQRIVEPKVEEIKIRQAAQKTTYVAPITRRFAPRSPPSKKPARSQPDIAFSTTRAPPRSSYGATSSTDPSGYRNRQVNVVESFMTPSQSSQELPEQQTEMSELRNEERRAADCPSSEYTEGTNADLYSSTDVREEVRRSNTNVPTRHTTTGPVVYDDGQGPVQELYREWRSESFLEPTEASRSPSRHRHLEIHQRRSPMSSNTTSPPSRKSTSSSVSYREQSSRSSKQRELNSRNRDNRVEAKPFKTNNMVEEGAKRPVNSSVEADGLRRRKQTRRENRNSREEEP
jgi:hypothetical protein